MDTQRINEDLEMLTLEDGTTALISFSNVRDISQGCIEKISYKGSSRTGEAIRLWGRRNDLPQYREQVVGDNNIVGSLIQTKRDLLVGTGLYAYRMEFKSDGGKRNIVEVPIPEEAQKFFDLIDIDTYMMDAAKDLLYHANIFTEFVRKNGGPIHSMKVVDCKYVRLGEQSDRGVVENAFISGAWATGDYQKDGITEFDKKVIRVPLYDADQQQGRFILHTGDRMINDGYYNSPAWFAGVNWIQVANNIPIFHQSNLMNGYTIRFHIQIPKNYFKSGPVQGYDPTTDNYKKANDEESRRKSEFMENMNSMLAGTMKAGRAIFTTFDINEAIGKEYPGIKIEAINVDIKDKALLELFEKSNTANISAQGIHPTLANVESQGKLSSGSEMRNAYNVYLAVKTPAPRRILLKALDLVKKINGWDPEIHFGFGDTELVTLDENPAGKEQKVPTVPDEE